MTATRSGSIHPTALVHAGARLGENVSVGPYAVIEDDVIVGDGTSIAGHAVIKRYTRIGRENRIYEHAVVGGDPQDVKFRDCVSYVSIGDGNLIREGVTIHRGSTAHAHTRIGNNCFLMANCHIAHDCTLGDHVVIANGSLLGGVVSIGDRAFISGAVTIHQFCRVGRLALLAASARINQDCLPFVITDGVPGRARGLNLVGLRRAQLSAAEIASLKRAFQTLRSATALESALAELDSSGSAAVAELVQFIRSSARGFAHIQR
jgi:UDP-N-acetylglucosamine acyltransferase